MKRLKRTKRLKAAERPGCAVSAGWTLAAAAWTFVIFGLSSMPMARQDLKPWLSRRLSQPAGDSAFGWLRFRYGGRLIGIEPLGAAGFVEFVVRKAAHFAEYAALAALLFLALRRGGRARGFAAAAVMAACCLLAAADEYRQSFVAGRTPLAEDALLDAAGAACGVWLSARRRRSRGSGTGRPAGGARRQGRTEERKT